MIIGVPCEVKEHEYRVGLLPSGAHELVAAGHRVLTESGAAVGVGILDDEYTKVGAEVAGDVEELYSLSDLIVKVKEPQPHEVNLLRPGQILFTYLHLAAFPVLTRALLDRGIIGIAYETVQLEGGGLPLLKPMSEIAGRLAVQAGASYLEKERGGRGVLLGGVPGVEPGSVLVLGGGTVGINAARMAVGLGARVTIVDSNLERLRYLDDLFQGRVVTLTSNRYIISDFLRKADLVIGGVLIVGARAPRLVTGQMVASMREGSVIVDVSIDQGGCMETSRPTTYSNPTYQVDGVIHYCVTNMPGGVSRTSTFALTNATFPYVMLLASKGLKGAMRETAALARGLNLYEGKVTHAAVAESLSYPFYAPSSVVS